MIRRILVIGAAGRLGAATRHAFADADVTCHTRATLDITDAAAVRRAVADSRPEAIVNCAAFNDVDGAEDRPSEAMAVNAFAVRGLARAAEDAGAALVHYSTDFVFDGRGTEPYTEAVTPAPRSIYAMSKLLGEWFALDASGAFVLRVESLFGTPAGWSGRRGTLDGIVGGLLDGREVKVFTDRTVSPSYVADVAAATRHLLETGSESGLYHCVNSGVATWYQVAEEAARLLGVAPRLKPVTMDQMQLKAERPLYCALANDKLARAGFTMPTWQDGLRRWLAGTRQPAA
jgi:dTDP-4-dehydrorhamnose reductase